MKINHIWSILCKESIINQDDNLISLYGALEEVAISLKSKKQSGKTPEKINIPIKYEIVSLWLKNKLEGSVNAKVEYTLKDPKGSELLSTTQNMHIPSNIRRFRTRMKISGIPITKEGDYYFSIKIKERGEKSFHLVSKLPLEVKINKENSQTTPLPN